MSTEVKTATKTAAPLKTIFAVRLETPGARACGPYLSGEIYKVGDDGLSNEEANRLVNVKSFTAMTTAQVAAAEKPNDNKNDTAKTGES